MNANTSNQGYGMPSMHLSKKSHAKYSMGKSKQSTLFDEEIKAASGTPGPLHYQPSHEQVTASVKFSKNILGYGVKSNQEPIKRCPGPADHMQDHTANFNDKLSTFNFKIKMDGGIKRHVFKSLRL